MNGMKWSVSLVAEGDRIIQLEEVVDLADAVAANNGVATGMGTHSYGARIDVEADDSDHAVELAMKIFQTAVATAGLPAWPITHAETLTDDEDLFEDGDW